MLNRTETIMIFLLLSIWITACQDRKDLPTKRLKIAYYIEDSRILEHPTLIMDTLQEDTVCFYYSYNCISRADVVTMIDMQKDYTKDSLIFSCIDSVKIDNEMIYVIHIYRSGHMGIITFYHLEYGVILSKGHAPNYIILDHIEYIDSDSIVVKRNPFEKKIKNRAVKQFFTYGEYFTEFQHKDKK